MGRWLLFVVVLMALVNWQMGTAPLHGAIDWLAAQPQLGGTLLGSDVDAREDALSLVFVSIFGAPLAIALALTALAFVLTALAEAVRPIVRALALPEGAAPAGVVAALVLTAWVIRDAWLPRSLWVLGVLARACRVVIT